VGKEKNGIKKRKLKKTSNEGARRRCDGVEMSLHFERADDGEKGNADPK